MKAILPIPQAVAGAPMSSSINLAKTRIHLVGVGGSGMSGLARILLHHGARVSGTDRCLNSSTAALARLGAAICTTQQAGSLPDDAELVVSSAAILADHPELVEARQRGLRVLKYAEMLGVLMHSTRGVAISGTHGKSTTTAWLAYVLRRVGLDPSFLVGAEVPQLGGSSGVGGGELFVAEACEYDRSFLNLEPHLAAILNIEADHLDCYADMAAIREAFSSYAACLPGDGLLVINGDDPQCALVAPHASAAVETFGRSEGCTWRATGLESLGGRYSFNVERDGQPVGRVSIGLAGVHNVYNALAVTALATRCGAAWSDLARALGEFQGAQRRLELIGEVNGVRVVDDYAHHPTAVRATLAAARERFAPGRLWCVFQPHQYSRTRALLEEFGRCFEAADEVIVPEIYSVRDSAGDLSAVCAADLVRQVAAHGTRASFMPSFDQITQHLMEAAQAGDVVLVMGAGDIWKVGHELVRRLRENLPQ